MTPLISMHRSTPQSGFALLITLIVVSVVLAIGLSLIDITVKQLSLSVSARDSEISFYAANAGIECAQAERLTISPASTIPGSLTMDCFQQSRAATYSRYSGNRVHRYEHAFSWNNGIQDLCTDVNIFIIDARGGGITFNFASTGDPLGLDQKQCTNGEICTVMFSTGYNRACNNLGGLRTIQRELTIEN